MAVTDRERRRKLTWRPSAIDEGVKQRPWLVTAMLVAVITAATWPLITLQPGVGIDRSWMLGLNLAATEHLQYGADVVYTYGPLGYLTSPVLGALWPAALGVLFLLVVQVALVTTLLAWTRPLLGTAVAAGTTFAIATFTIAPLAEVLPVLTLGWCISVVCGTRRSPTGRWLLPGLAALAGLQLVVKFNIGLTSIAVVLLCAWFFPPERWRSLGIAAASVLAGFMFGWLVALQDPRNIPSWLSSSWDITSGYASAMNIDFPTTQWQYIPALGLQAAVLWAVWTETRELALVRRAILVIATGVCLYATFKHNFVRAYSMVDILLACAILAFAPTARTKRMGLACGICFGAILSLVAISGGPVRQYDPVEIAVRPFTHTLNLIDPSRRAEVRQQGATAIMAAVGVDGSLLHRIGRSTVAIDPTEISVAWAYGLNWRPVPVFQPFTAYTTSLDRLEADDLASPSAPHFILRRTDAIGLDQRLRALDSPAYFLAMLCRYRQVALVGAWALLERAPDRCGRPKEISTSSARAGTQVPVPDGGTHNVIYAKLSFSPSLWARLRDLVFKPAHLPLLYVTRATDVVSYRYVVDTGQSPNVFWVPPSAGFAPGPPGGDLRARSISLLNVPSYRITFFRVPFSR